MADSDYVVMSKLNLKRMRYFCLCLVVCAMTLNYDGCLRECNLQFAVY